MLRLVPPRVEPQPAEAPPARTVLVVDDLPEILELWRGLARRVRGMRVRVVTEVNGPRAVDFVSRNRFDLVVSDHRLGPGIDGLTVLQQARRCNPEGRRALMTGYQEIPAPLHRVRSAEVDAYLAKPFSTQDAVRLLEGLLAAHPVSLAAGRHKARELEAEAEASDGHVHVVPLRATTFAGPRAWSFFGK